MPAAESDRDVAVRLARETLAADLKVSPSSITVEEVDPAEWTDGNLGCPGGRTAGAPTLTPGWRIVLSVGGRDYPVRVGADRAVRCAEGVPQSDLRPAEARGRLLDRIRADLARRQGIAVGEVKLKTIQRATWPDTSLGCPRPGKTYAQVITEGQSLELEAAGRTYRYHTSGSRFVYCPESSED
jgi:hypothetical protein